MLHTTRWLIPPALTPPLSAYKTAHSTEEDQLLAERSRIDSSHRMTDDILMYGLYLRKGDIFLLLSAYRQAQETRAEFGRQRSSILGMNTRMGGVISE